MRYASGLIGTWVCQQPSCPEFWQVQPTEEEFALVLAAKQLLSDEGRWTQSTPARNEHHREVKPTAPDACKWCVVGAIAHLSPGGIVPYNVLRYLDEKIIEFIPMLPAVTRKGFEWTHDHYFTHSMMLNFLDYVLASSG